MTASTPTRPIVVYDGECSFCRKQVDRVRRLDSGGVFECVPRQDATLLARFPRLAEGDFETGMRLVDEDGTIHVGADAVHAIAQRLPRFRGLAGLYRVPGVKPLCRGIYAFIARNRHRL